MALHVLGDLLGSVGLLSAALIIMDRLDMLTPILNLSLRFRSVAC